VSLFVNKLSKNFNERPHRRLVTPAGCEMIRLMLTPVKKVPWTHMSQPQIGHFDRFTRFCTACPCAHHTYTQTQTTVRAAFCHVCVIYILKFDCQFVMVLGQGRGLRRAGVRTDGRVGGYKPSRRRAA